jgi:glutathione transport system permease protein
VAVLVFLFVHLLPGDPARLAAGPDADEQPWSWCADLGLDKPLPQQFVRFFSHMLQGDFGTVDPHQAAGVHGDRGALRPTFC